MMNTGSGKICCKDREPIGRHSTLKKNHSIDVIIRDPNNGVSMRSKVRDQVAMLSQMESKSVNEAPMKGELDQF